MSRYRKEKRRSPRVPKKIAITLPGNIRGHSVDMSEHGARMGTGETISSPTISLQIKFPDKTVNIETEARLVWTRNLSESEALYGLEFVGLDKQQKKILRKELIELQISELLKGIKNPKIKEKVSRFFLEDVLSYITNIVQFLPDMSNNGAYSPEIESELDSLTNKVLLKGYSLDVLLSDKAIMDQVKENFRKLVGTWVYKSDIVRRAFEKPRGYPGDYKMLEIVYDNETFTSGAGRYFDATFLKSPYAVAVRIRKDQLRELIGKYIKSSQLERIKIFDIACGSCREIRELIPELPSTKSVEFTFLDWDEEALEFSREKFNELDGRNLRYEYVQEDVMRLMRDKKVQSQFQGQDFIYSIGLIDYLPDRILKRLIAVLYKLLNKQGRLVLTHKNRVKTFPPVPPDWFCDWKFYPRDRDEVLRLFLGCGIPRDAINIDVDNFGYIYYFTITKE
ncbi:methyltransferase domain-containing protein [Candidatus Peregrinibacteria bacterium]|nr:methyltransferase domain-containing protein [Candidatus Peregrinibacteria bacterium]